MIRDLVNLTVVLGAVAVRCVGKMFGSIYQAALHFISLLLQINGVNKSWQVDVDDLWDCLGPVHCLRAWIIVNLFASALNEFRQVEIDAGSCTE